VAVTIGPRLAEFFNKRLLAILATTNERGAPEMTPVWYEYADGQIWFNGQASRHWLQRMQASGLATFFLMDDENAWKWAQVYGRVVEVADDVDSRQFARLGERYLGRMREPPPDRVFVRIEITAVKGRSGSPRDSWDVS
jgi:PPOX class probable F420-dependent enzyme